MPPRQKRSLLRSFFKYCTKRTNSIPALSFSEPTTSTSDNAGRLNEKAEAWVPSTELKGISGAPVLGECDRYLLTSLEPAQASNQIPPAPQQQFSDWPPQSGMMHNLPDGEQAPRTDSPDDDDNLTPVPRRHSARHEFVISGPSVFTGARHTRVENLSIHQAGPEQDTNGWKLLMEKTAPNALHNSDARFDPPKCDEDTRIEVTSEILVWIQDRSAPTQLLCMTGAAGSGKSALQQTSAEHCEELGILASSFFFSTSDPTRNGCSALVPTIAYQLGLKSLRLRRAIAAVVDHDPLIFTQSLKSQMQALVVDPVRQLPTNALSDLPFAILIDGLDECNDEDRQRGILEVLQECMIGGRTPFRIFLASRPELAIHGALQPGGHLERLAYHIRLSDDYDATTDIRRSVQRMLHEIGRRRNLNPTWYTDEDVEAIVKAASGQYIYAATAMRYVSEPRGSPLDRLNAVVSWSLSGGGEQTSPFASLDFLYSQILLKAKQAYEAVDTNRYDFLLTFNSYVFLDRSLPLQDQILGYEDQTSEHIICDLRSLVTWSRSGCLNFYHKSFEDFLDSETRAGPLYMKARALDHIIAGSLRWVAKHSELDVENAMRTNSPFGDVIYSVVFTILRKANRQCYSLDNLVDTVIHFTEAGGWEKIHIWVVQPWTIGSTHPFHEAVTSWLEIFEWLIPLMKVCIRSISPVLTLCVLQTCRTEVGIHGR
ncbi:hypothetical protein DFP72DRAFT_32567 [Ephemerocybe angulata]|uniref:Nephrocystin 3-like N-terminal domain-containing protein n=1 Tax=Ephemerocybe angulata TaxID=980116 RepID=A0A8H6MEM7_9AGAR|nr:hypothetical protein DFP72DRAFT_32567 [Tulosesus angulatus]